MFYDSKKPAAVAIAFSVVALLVSVYSATLTWKLQKEDAFSARVEKGIEAYIQKQIAGDTDTPAAAAPTERKDVSADDDAVLGNADAPITIVEFSDYQCPFCERFFSGALPQIESNYIKTGKAKLVYRDFPLSFHQMARPAAMAAECVREQKGDAVYYAFHNLIFENQADLSVDNLKKWAAGLKVNASKFNTCLDTEQFGAEVDKDFADGQSYGVSGTPAFFVNGQFISGAQPYNVFEQAIEAALKQ